MTIVDSLKALPLFQGIALSSLTELVGTFRPITRKAGTVLFRPGELATHFELLTSGEVTIEEEGAARFQLKPVAPLGELGALTEIPRSTTATATTDIDVLSIGVGDLMGFFEERPAIGLPFYKNLLGVVSDKVRRDRRRMDEMRVNIIRTQKAMKQMRDLVLTSRENELSKPIFETLDTMIGNNRRANYRVSPPPSYAAQMRLDDGREVPVLELSEGFAKVDADVKELTKDPTYFAGVLVMPTDEIVVSGSIFREANDGVVLKFDTLVDEFKVKLDDYTTRVQLLDFVV